MIQVLPEEEDPDDEEFGALEIRKTELMSALAEAIEYKRAQELHQDSGVGETIEACIEEDIIQLGSNGR